MRTDLDHLPSIKRREIAKIVEAIHEEFADALSMSQHQWKTAGCILKIILYGSHARGDWVNFGYTAVGKVSDYDLLIIVNDERLTDEVQYWAKLQDRLDRAYYITHNLRAPAEFIVHSLAEVNDALRHGRYFFIDIKRDGILLYESDDTALAESQTKTPQAAFTMAREYYDEWFPSALEFYDDFESNLNRGRLKKAAFELHQCVERLYHAVLLVCTFYTPHVHRLSKLRSQAEPLDLRLAVWPRETEEDEANFAKLQEAYTKARYRKNFHITEAQLDWLAERAKALMQAVQSVCEERLKAMAAETKT